MSVDCKCVVCDKLFERPKREYVCPRCRGQARMAQAKRFVKAIKLTAGCAKCGYREHQAAIQLDHIKPVRKRGRHNGALSVGSKPRIVSIVMNPETQFLCANCHAIKTFEEGYT